MAPRALQTQRVLADLGCGLMLSASLCRQVRPTEKFFEDVPEIKVDEEPLELATELIARKAGGFEIPSSLRTTITWRCGS